MACMSVCRHPSSCVLIKRDKQHQNLFSPFGSRKQSKRKHWLIGLKFSIIVFLHFHFTGVPFVQISEEARVISHSIILHTKNFKFFSQCKHEAVNQHLINIYLLLYKLSLVVSEPSLLQGLNCLQAPERRKLNTCHFL